MNFLGDDDSIFFHTNQTKFALIKELFPNMLRLQPADFNLEIRVSLRISNSPRITSIVTSMEQKSESIRDALCFFMDDEQNNNIAFIQYPQYFDNITKNDVYGNYLRLINELNLRQTL